MSIARTAPVLSPTFLAIWAGQLVSLTGSALTHFALGVWVFQHTGSVTQFALTLACQWLPSVLIGPLAGVLVDRFDRRMVMLASEICAGLAVFALALLLWSGQLQLWQICVATGIGSICAAVQWSAYAAATTLLVPQKYLGRANGLIMLAQAVSQLGAPALGGLLLGLVSIDTILVLDVLTFACASATLLAVRIPALRTAAAQATTLRADMAYGWRYLRERRGLLTLLIFFALGNYYATLVQVLLTPLALSFMSVQELGTVMSVAGVGMVLGSVAMSVWGGERHHLPVIMLFSLIQGLVLLLAWLPPNPWLMGGIAWVYMFCVPIILSASQAIWQRKVAPEVQGRVFATRRMLATAIMPLAYLTAGPLADQISHPLHTGGAPLDTGAGSSIVLIYIAIGALQTSGVLLACCCPRLRRVERELPDATVATAAPQRPARQEPAKAAA